MIPYFHIYAFSVCMMTGIWIGRAAVILPKYDPEQVLAAIRDFRPTYFPAVPTVFVSLLNHPRVGEFGLEHVRTFNSGGAPCPVEVHRGVRAPDRPPAERGLRAVRDLAGHALHAAARPAQAGHDRPAVPGTDMKSSTSRPATRELPLGEAGELCICGPAGDEGLLEQARRERVRAADGDDGRIWFHTGDIARVDEDGYTSIVQRKKDLIIVDGFNVYPSEVEAVLYSHPAVRLAAVIGIPDPYHGEIVKACIAFKPGAAATAEEIIAFCRESLTRYKVPRRVDIRDTLPMSAVGKILYRVLRDEHARPQGMPATGHVNA